jgi:hypothetical protein
VPNCKSFLNTEAERKHFKLRALFNNIKTRAVISFVSARQGAEGNSHHSDRKLGGHAPSYATVKEWRAQFKRGDFSTCDVPRPGRSKRVTTPEIISQNH